MLEFLNPFFQKLTEKLIFSMGKNQVIMNGRKLLRTETMNWT